MHENLVTLWMTKSADECWSRSGPLIATWRPIHKWCTVCSRIANVFIKLFQSGTFQASKNYEVFEEVMKSSPPDSLQKRIYNNWIPMDLIRNFLIVPEFKKTMDALFKIFYSLVCYEKSVFDFICCETGETPICFIDPMFENNLYYIGRLWRRFLMKHPEPFCTLR